MTFLGHLQGWSLTTPKTEKKCRPSSSSSCSCPNPTIQITSPKKTPLLFGSRCFKEPKRRRRPCRNYSRQLCRRYSRQLCRRYSRQLCINYLRQIAFSAPQFFLSVPDQLPVNLYAFVEHRTPTKHRSTLSLSSLSSERGTIYTIHLQYTLV